jgi:hypothetical protein
MQAWGSRWPERCPNALGGNRCRPRHSPSEVAGRLGGQIAPSKTKLIQIKLLGLACFIRPKRDFSMGSGEKNKKIPSVFASLPGASQGEGSILHVDLHIAQIPIFAKTLLDRYRWGSGSGDSVQPRRSAQPLRRQSRGAGKHERQRKTMRVTDHGEVP